MKWFNLSSSPLHAGVLLETRFRLQQRLMSRQHSLSIQGLCAAAADVVTAVTEGGATNLARSTLCIWLACCVMTCLIMWIRRRKREVQMSHETSSVFWN